MPEKKTRWQDSEATARWTFLDAIPDVCGVVTDNMEVAYLNAAARSLVPDPWIGRRCWEVFPVNKKCAAGCPAIEAVSGSSELLYCEEHIHPDDQTSILLGVIVISLRPIWQGEEKALLLMRPKPAEDTDDRMRDQLFLDGKKLQTLCARQLSGGLPEGSPEA